MDPMYTRSQACSLAETVVHKPAAHLGLSLFWSNVALPGCEQLAPSVAHSTVP